MLDIGPAQHLKTAGQNLGSRDRDLPARRVQCFERAFGKGTALGYPSTEPACSGPTRAGTRVPA